VVTMLGRSCGRNCARPTSTAGSRSSLSEQLPEVANSDDQPAGNVRWPGTWQITVVIDSVATG
jgi:hypothetical protein